MSVRSMIRRQGTLVDWYRPSGYTTSADGANRVPTSFTLLQAGVELSVSDMGLELREKTFVRAEVSEALGFVVGSALLPGDRIVATAGPFEGDTWVVEEVKKLRAGSTNDHDEVALISTDETVP